MMKCESATSLDEFRICRRVVYEMRKLKSDQSLIMVEKEKYNIDQLMSYYSSSYRSSRKVLKEASNTENCSNSIFDQ